jgi:hypothetical protein
MATLLLTALGTAIGGPLGGAIGAFIGQQADRRIFGTGKREGPRLKELSVTTSSYGQPIPRQFGRMRVAGAVIWATDLAESKNKASGGKGQPSLTTYSYSASFAVAVSSTPIASVGRIWADGNLLRGAGDDLKVGGSMRVYCGHGDDPVDPLIAADKGPDAPAFRDCAYVVFEDLQLADFGNRIPALTFEIIADGADEAVSLGQIVPPGAVAADRLALNEARGFADEGGPVIGSLAAIDQVFPLICTSGANGLMLAAAERPAEAPLLLPAQLSMRGEQDADSRHRQRADIPAREPVALRYYDEERDYQPGVQRALGLRAAGREAMLDLPATMNASGARQLANANAHRARWQHERITWHIGELDPALAPGRVVRVPDQSGHWLVRGWEWHDRGVELSLERLPPALGAAVASDPGAANNAADLVITPTLLAFFEAAPDGISDPAAPLLYAAVSSASAGWRGAALFAERGGALEPVGTAGTRRAVTGVLAGPLGPSSALLFEPAASLEVALAADDLAFTETDITGLAGGANRLMVGGEVLQFARAEPRGAGLWRLCGLLRGRGGTEPAAMQGHAAGVPVILLDDRLTPLDPAQVPASTGSRIAASGIADPAPVMATLANPGLSRQPLMPVHPRLTVLPDLVWEMGWTRRARGQWHWHDGVDAALVEQTESYLVGYGPPDAPLATWTRAEPSFRLAPDERAALRAQADDAWLWVRQIGTHALSPALPLIRLT